MEFTPELSALQGIIISADSVYSFSKLKERGGNEERIDYVVDNLRIFLQKGMYMRENGVLEENTQNRKFAFYICLNSDLPILEELIDLDGIAFLIWTIPTVPKCLMCDIFWKLHMEKFIFEIIVFTCPLLSLEVAEAFLDHFKYFDPTECIQKLKMLALGCYRMMYRLVFFNLEGDEITRSFNNFRKCLTYFSEPPNVSKLERLSTDDEYKYIGNRLYEMLQLVSECFTHYTGPQKFKPSDFQDLYELSYRDGIVINEQSTVPISQCNNSDVLESINNCNIALLDKCKSLIMEVSVEIFCAWSEFEENGRSMQQTIGELCYNVHSDLCKISGVSDHPVVGMLQQISCKPLLDNLAEVINKSDTAAILENINKENNESTHWIKALVHKENLCDDINLIIQVTSHLEVFNEVECYKLYNIVYGYLKDNIDNKEMLLLLAIKAFQRCSINNQYEKLDEHFSNSSLNDNLETTEFDNMMTEIFNKLIISPDADLSDILTVFLQNPRKVYSKIFHLASENMHQTDIMIHVMTCLERYSKHYYNDETEPCIVLVTKEIIAHSLDTEDKQNIFISFLKDLKSAKAIPGPKLLLLIIMPNLHSGLVNKDISQICIQCKLLQAAYTFDELKEYRAPTLAMLAQVLDTVRWKMNTYVAQAPSTLELVLQIQLVLNTNDMTEKESIWLKSKLRNINPLNMYYFRRLWNPPGNTFVEVISGMHIHKDMDIEHLSLWLSQTLSSTILQEWYQIWDSLCTVFGNVKILDVFHDALLLLCVAEKSNSTEPTKACLMYCMKNFVATTRLISSDKALRIVMIEFHLQYKFFKMPLNDNQVTTVFDKFSIIENVVNESYIDELGTIFLPLFAYMAEKKQDLSTGLPYTLVRKFKHKKFTDMIKNLFITKVSK